MKTIQQIADDLNVSKTSIRKHIRKLGMETSLRKDGNKFLIDETQEELIKNSFSETETETSSRTSSQTDFDVVRVLEKQLDEKQRTIDALLEKIDQEQKLNAMLQQKLDKYIALEDKADQKKGIFAWFRRE